MDRKNFPLVHLGFTLDALADEIHNGKGFCLLRGLEADRYSLEDGMIVFLGIQSYVAEQRMRQDEVGNVLGRIHTHALIATLTSSPVHVTADPSNRRLSKHVRHSTDTIVRQEIAQFVSRD